MKRIAFLMMLLLAVPAWAQGAPADGSETVATAKEEVLSAPPKQAEPIAEAVSERTVLDGYVWSTSPVALRTGLVLGGGADLRHALGSWGAFLGARLALGSTSEATREWELQHLHGLACATAGIERRVGAGRLSAQLEAGGLMIRQLGQRQQYQRLSLAGLQDIRRDSWSFGPWVAAELGAAVVFYDAWSAFVQLGPAFTRQTVAGQQQSQWILSTGLGVARAF